MVRKGQRGEIIMNRTTIVAIVVAGILAIAVPFCVIEFMDGGDDEPPPTTHTYQHINFYVYFGEDNRKNLLPNDEENGPLVGQGKDMEEIVQNAFSGSDMYTLELNSVGSVQSVNSVEADDGMAWVIFQWGPGWKALSPGSQIDATLVENTSYMVSLVECSDSGKRVTYKAPEVDGPKSWATFCLIYHNYSGPVVNYLDCTILPEQLAAGEKGEEYLEQLETGLWISGYGSSAAEALYDACMRAFGWVPFDNGNGGTGLRVPDDRCDNLIDRQKIGLQGMGYLENFIGLSDVNGASGWVYWNQFSWSDEYYSWGFNGYGLGGYDPAVTKFLGLAYQPGGIGGSSNPFQDMDPYDYVEA